MKKITLFLFAGLLVFRAGAQSEKYMKAMEALVPAVDTTHSIEGLADLANSFERIANAEKTQWLPYYYAALTHVMKGFSSIGKVFGENVDIMEVEANKADECIEKAEKLVGENAESLCVKNMISGLRIMLNPAVNGMKFGAIAEQYLAKAKELDSNNPRIYLLEGQSALYKPKEWGGGKEIALSYLKIAQEKYLIFKLQSDIDPNWGKQRVEDLIIQIQKGN